jgi:hypothetical protein
MAQLVPAKSRHRSLSSQRFTFYGVVLCSFPRLLRQLCKVYIFCKLSIFIKFTKLSKRFKLAKVCQGHEAPRQGREEHSTEHSNHITANPTNQKQNRDWSEHINYR